MRHETLDFTVKFFKRIIELFTSNWGLKLISLLLAIIIFHSNKTDKSRNQESTAHDRPLIQFR